MIYVSFLYFKNRPCFIGYIYSIVFPMDLNFQKYFSKIDPIYIQYFFRSYLDLCMVFNEATLCTSLVFVWASEPLRYMN